MIVIIVGGTLGGKYLDNYTQFKFPVFTLIGVLLGLFLAMYMVIKDLLKK